MANHCYNRLSLTGDPQRVEAATQLFKDIQQSQEIKNTFHRPEFIKGEDNKMWDITFGEDNIFFKSDNGPILGALYQIAVHFDIGFINRYQDLQNFVYGETYYQNGPLSGLALSATDFAAYQYDQKNKVFIFDGKTFEREGDLITLLFESKKKNILDKLNRLEMFIPHNDEEILLRTENQVTKAEIEAIYGPLLDGHLLLKFAEHKNFVEAKAIFDQFDEQSVDQVDGYLRNNFRGMPENFDNDESYIAHAFLEHLTSEWYKKYRQQITDPSLDYPI
jgi:hypothetical protein